jgi:hypothetical protein
MELLVLVIGLVALGLLATRFGYDSRDGFSNKVHGRGVSATGRFDSAYEQELAREILEARRHRVSDSRVVNSQRHHTNDDLAQAA